MTCYDTLVTLKHAFKRIRCYHHTMIRQLQYHTFNTTATTLHYCIHNYCNTTSSYLYCTCVYVLYQLYRTDTKIQTLLPLSTLLSYHTVHIHLLCYCIYHLFIPTRQHDTALGGWGHNTTNCTTIFHATREYPQEV